MGQKRAASQERRFLKGLTEITFLVNHCSKYIKKVVTSFRPKSTFADSDGDVRMSGMETLKYRTMKAEDLN
ncbi:MAG: hypothetical protein AAB681_03450 [Patescibacteria group bacterium]